MSSRTENLWAIRWALTIVGLSCLPYLAAWQLAPAGTHYTGLLINPLDGESYYAKMQQGVRGDWLFQLPFTSEPHEGAFIYSLYLALGHLAAATGLPIPLIYHLARVVAGLFLLVVAYRFITHFFDRIPTRRTALLLLGFSAGLGWLLAPLGLTTADLWVAEGFTLLSILANPHFPLAIGLILLIFLKVLASPSSTSALSAGATEGMQTPDTAGVAAKRASLPTQPGIQRLSAGGLLGAAGLALLLAVIQPFAVPIVLVVLGVYLALVTWRERHLPRTEIAFTAAAALAAAPIMVYDIYVYRTNPALAAWASQNLTPSLPPWDYTLGYGLILLLALGGMVVALRRRERKDLFLLAWVGSVAVLLYLPFALQRRFITGLHVPLTLLAALGLEQVVWPRLRAHWRPLITALVIGFTALTSFFVPLVAVIGVAQGQHPLVMTADEVAACAWLGERTTWTDTVLTPPAVGQFIPAWAGNRVVFGHPFETIDAEAKKAGAERFYHPAATLVERRALLDRYGVRYVLVPMAVSLDPEALGLSLVWTGNDDILYRVESGP